MLIARTRAELDAHLSLLRATRGMLALVPTMGALHDGHLSLIEAARREVTSSAATSRPDAGAVVASIFVNPLQFGDGADLARYPRDEAGDTEKLVKAACDLLFLPSTADIYPDGDATVIDVAGPALDWEGAARPGHFRGVATVVGKLFGQIKPDAACFGEKDFQQLQVIRRMTADLALGVRIVGVPTWREADGLAMSSRNRFLSAAERAIAPHLYQALCNTRDALRGDASSASRGGEAPDRVLADARAVLAQAGFVVEYLSLVSAETLRPLQACQADARLIAAARLGSVRLLDNIAA
jgi:pantoate--beta-alanine ligase